MKLDNIMNEVKAFCAETHGSTDYYKDETFVRGADSSQYAPMSYLKKKMESLKDSAFLLSEGFVHDSLDMYGQSKFQTWYETQFSRKLKRADVKKISILHQPNNKSIFDAVEMVTKAYEVLEREQIIINGKKLPVQLGEWYTKIVFGLHQKKSTSQRGFDFYIGDKRVEVKVHWGDQSSPKGVKIRKSLIELSDYTILMYVNKKFMIREICFLDSDFVLRKYAGKGHTVFLKDVDLMQYFFSKSEKQKDKVKNKSALMRYACPTLAMKLAEAFES
jgi:hypothetical protein